MPSNALSEKHRLRSSGNIPAGHIWTWLNMASVHIGEFEKQRSARLATSLLALLIISTLLGFAIATVRVSGASALTLFPWVALAVLISSLMFWVRGKVSMAAVTFGVSLLVLVFASAFSIQGAAVSMFVYSALAALLTLGGYALRAVSSARRKQVEHVESALTNMLDSINSDIPIEHETKAFVANVLHELRSPIASLKLYHILLARASSPERHEEYLEAAQRETERLVRTIDGLQRLSRLDEQHTQLQLTPVDLNALAGQYVADRSLLAESRGLSLILDRRPDLPLVYGDEGLLGQVLSILLSNALSYTPGGGEIVVRSLAQERASQPWAGFSVSDTGPGIPTDEQEHLFERFFRGSVGRASDVSGAGLGLAIAREIVEQHGGGIAVESHAHVGSTFRVMLPPTITMPYQSSNNGVLP